MLLACLLACAAFAGVLLFSSLPSVTDAPARVRAIETAHRGRPVQLARNAKLARALVAVEDERFFDHGAIDLLSVGRAIKASVTASADPGGSTITQQLAKVLYVKKPESFAGRLQAIGLAFKLEQRYSKVQILNLYLNAVYFGHGFYGARAAARGYFNQSADSLSWSRAALLAGLPQAPSAYDPDRHLARARARQRQVLKQLVSNGVLTPAAASSAARTPLQLRKR